VAISRDAHEIATPFGLAMTSMLKKIKNIGEMVKFSHSVFALPFALASLLVATQGKPSCRLLIWIILAMVTLRTGAMAFNRYLDADIDAKNPRTATRHIPQNILSKNFVLLLALTCAAFFIIITQQINSLCFKLSGIAVLVTYGYSFAKRWTAASHLILGFALGMSPIGAWSAATNHIGFSSIVLGLSVIFWVAGFDMIYATQDYEFDKKEGLHSLVVTFGIAKALRISRIFHIITLVLLYVFGFLSHFGGTYTLTLLVIAILFLYEHRLVSAKDLSRVNAAFFTLNGFISLIFLVGVFLSLQRQ